MSVIAVAVEKVPFSRNSENLGDRKCLGKLRKPFVGLPNAKFFRPFSGEGVFQHPQAFTLIENSAPSPYSDFCRPAKIGKNSKARKTVSRSATLRFGFCSARPLP